MRPFAAAWVLALSALGCGGPSAARPAPPSPQAARAVPEQPPALAVTAVPDGVAVDQARLADAVFPAATASAAPAARRHVLATTPQGTFAIDDGSALVRVVDGAVVAAIARPDAVAVSPRGNFVALFDEEALVLFDGPTLNPIKRLKRARITDVKFSPAGDRMAVTVNDARDIPHRVAVYGTPSLELSRTHEATYATFTDAGDLCVQTRGLLRPVPSLDDATTVAVCVETPAAAVRWLPKSSMRTVGHSIVTDTASDKLAALEERPVDDPPPMLHEESGCGSMPEPRRTRVYVASRGGAALWRLDLGVVEQWRISLRFAEEGRVIEVCGLEDHGGRFEIATGMPIGPCE